MPPRIRRTVAARAVAAALGCLLVLSCKSTSTVYQPPVASFTADAPSPANGSVTLQPGKTTGQIVEVKVSVRGVPDFFGAAFWITYDTSYVTYYKFDDSTSFLRDGGSDITVQVDALSTPGRVKVGIARIQNADGTLRGVDVSDLRDVIVLSFIGTKIVTGSPITFTDGQGKVVNSSQPPNDAIDVTWAGGTLSLRQ